MQVCAWSWYWHFFVIHLSMINSTFLWYSMVLSSITCYLNINIRSQISLKFRGDRSILRLARDGVRYRGSWDSYTQHLSWSWTLWSYCFSFYGSIGMGDAGASHILILHKGLSSNSSHYISMVKIGDIWYQCDDVKCTRIEYNNFCNLNTVYYVILQ